jgi:hypothetical protein
MILFREKLLLNRNCNKNIDVCSDVEDLHYLRALRVDTNNLGKKSEI